MSTMSGGPNIITNGLVLHLDAGNIKSYKGVPTTNLLADASLFIYNNVPAHVTVALTQTSDTYRGVPIWKETLTPTTATGVSYLTSGNNPGIGVYSNGGGGTANRYTGFSIFFKPTVSMHSSPIYTQYSNISGWQSSINYDDMGDGWFRAHVIWYDTVTRSDGKFWAINPLTSTLNTPIEIFWAGPFKEDRNDSVYVSQFVNGTRGTTVATGGGWADRTKNGYHGELVGGTSYNASNVGSIVFDGVDDYISTNYSGTTAFTYEVFLKPTNVSKDQMYIGYTPITANYLRIVSSKAFLSISANGQKTLSHDLTLQNNQIYHIVSIYNGIQMKIYVNNQLTTSSAINESTFTWGIDRIGRWTDGDQRSFVGNIYSVKIYNKELTASEIQQNYNAHKSRFGLT